MSNVQFPVIVYHPIDGQNQQAVDARELHHALGVGTQFKDWIQRRIQEYDFTEHTDFEVSLKNEQNPTGGRPSKDYMLTLDMAKELAMVEKTDKGKAVRRYFIEVEKAARAGFMSAPDPEDVLRADITRLFELTASKGRVYEAIAHVNGLSSSYVKYWLDRKKPLDAERLRKLRARVDYLLRLWQYQHRMGSHLIVMLERSTPDQIEDRIVAALEAGPGHHTRALLLDLQQLVKDVRRALLYDFVDAQNPLLGKGGAK